MITPKLISVVGFVLVTCRIPLTLLLAIMWQYCQSKQIYEASACSVVEFPMPAEIVWWLTRGWSVTWLSVEEGGQWKHILHKNRGYEYVACELVSSKWATRDGNVNCEVRQSHSGKTGIGRT